VVVGRRSASAQAAVTSARRSLLAWHQRFSRFIATSELCRLNEDPRTTVPVRPLMAALAQAAVLAAEMTGGLVDATLTDEIERAGYAGDLDGEPVAVSRALALAPPRRPARPRPRSRWRRITVDRHRGVVARPPGLRLDSGGLAKGLFADLLGAGLRGHDAFAIDCCGDLRLGGAAGLRRPVRVTSPFDDEMLHELHLADGGVATSGIGRRSWLDRQGRPAHHLLDPSSGRPAYTGVVQATALAPTALEAEVRAKAAILSGAAQAERWLPHGGVIVYDSGRHRVVAPGAVVDVRTAA
jgi:thiamine biosynthesis lipoprotein